MATFVPVARRYPLVVGTLLVGLTGLALLGSGAADAPRWLLSAFALGIAAHQVRGMVDDVRHGTWGIDILAITAIVATVAVGQYWAALVVVLMLTGGEALEDVAAGRARRELTALLERVPQLAHRVRADGTVEDVALDAVQVGDEVLVKPGEVLPVDGRQLTPNATLDESAITGESLPVEHCAGDALLSGTVNGPSALRLVTTVDAAGSQYQQIVALVREASESKAPFVRLADRVAVPFTLGALVLAGIAWAVSGDPVRFAEVLVVATPCPLLIATPVAFLAGMSRAAKAGIIVKDGGTLERLARIGTVAFDKTGTLTHGRPELDEITTAPGADRDELLRLAASVEQASGHALAAAVVGAAHARGLVLTAPSGVHEDTGHGVRGTVEGHEVAVGKLSYVTSRSRTPVEEIEPLAGHLVVYVAVDGDCAGALTLADTIRAESRPTLHALRELGVRTTLMLTGDSEGTARHVADELGINEVRASCLPADKVAAVAAAADRPVLMVGDGVNDAPVLAAADVGVAMGARGSSAASESADVVILLDDLFRVARAVAIGRRTVRVAMQAIGIGIGASVALMLLAATGHIPAIVGAGLQELVDLATILWALRAMRPGRGEPSAPVVPRRDVNPRVLVPA